MWMIQCQYKTADGTNGGGLYLNVDAIASVRSVKVGENYCCFILMVAGIEYEVVNPLTQVLDDLQRILRHRLESR